MLLRYLVTAILKKATKTKQDNGTYTEALQTIGSFRVQTQELNDEVSASVYGANLYRILRIKSTQQRLETYLNSKVDNIDDNISMYYIILNNRKYKIVSVNSKGIDLELV